MKIQIGDPIDLTLIEEELPQAELFVQDNSRNEPFQVFILQETYQQIWMRVTASPNIECGGVLIGHPFKTPDKSVTFVIIVGCIPQVASNSSIVHFTVGPKETAVARERLEKEYPGLLIVGWYHSHPGHGIFLSGQDMTIVRSIYNSDWHLALVVDPQHKLEGFFVGGEGKKLPDNCWAKLKKSPDSVRAIALYNQSRDLFIAGETLQAKRTMQNLQRLVDTSIEMDHWRERGGYRDIAGLIESSDLLAPINERDVDKQNKLYSDGMQCAKANHWDDAQYYLKNFIINSDDKVRQAFQVLEQAQKALADEKERERQRVLSKRNERFSKLLMIYLIVYVALLADVLRFALVDKSSYSTSLESAGWATTIIGLVAGCATIYLNIKRLNTMNGNGGYPSESDVRTRHNRETLSISLLLILLASVALTIWVSVILLRL